MRHPRLFALLCVSSFPLAASGAWLEIRTPSFTLTTDGDERKAAVLLQHLERLRSFFLAQANLNPGAADLVRVIAFRSRDEYLPYRLDAGGDAYYLGAGGRDYIVMPLDGPDVLRVAAHEYAHVIAHRQGLQLPAWLSEGLAEVFSTIRFSSGTAIVGAANPDRRRALLQDRWLPLSGIMTREHPAPARTDPRGMFYAESWALVHMFLFSPAYAPRFAGLLAGPADPAAIYRTSLDRIEQDLHRWLAQPNLPDRAIACPGPEPDPIPAATLSADDAQFALAGLDLALGRIDRARAAYERLQTARPADPAIAASLGRIAIADGRTAAARDQFRRAIALGIADARLCYEYAELAQDAGVPDADVIAALERAVALDPGFDDARYLLALALMHAERYAEALRHLQALRFVPYRRAFAYYTALAHTQTELGLRDEAAQSADEAHQAARNAEEVERADELAWIARSDIVVQMTDDFSGRLLRIPHREPDRAGDWNPFIEPTDLVQRVEGYLREVDCSASGLRLRIAGPGESLVVSIPHRDRIQVRGPGVAEFTCGKQDGPRVRVEYAASPADPAVAGLVRGIQFLP